MLIPGTKINKKGIMRSKTKIEYIYRHIQAIYFIIIKPIFIVSTLSRYIYPLDTHIFVYTCVAQSYYLVICWIHEDKHPRLSHTNNTHKDI